MAQKENEHSYVKSVRLRETLNFLFCNFVIYKSRRKALFCKTVATQLNLPSHGFPFSFFLFSFFWPGLWPMEVPGPRIEPTPQ